MSVQSNWFVRQLSNTVSSLYSAPASLVHVRASDISSPEQSPQANSQLNTHLWAVPVDHYCQDDTSLSSSSSSSSH
ncbi:hypothetical protein L798_14837 [Zootermopsis nevadensis]|uniref:Uncharacterized protein n=1 Tax=Zootermopsis nevadensis TaxID=136037 RepID=A0A067QQJ2_ZOONE|nr:hypothetical protein L798_14837 [Zootermopsis nevadensis]